MKTRAGMVLGAAAAALTVAACSAGTAAPTGTIRVTLLEYPGPMPANGKPPAIPRAGMAAFTDRNGHTVTVTVGASGKSAIHLAPGTYSALLAPVSLSPVRQSVRVAAGQTVKITILCSADSGTCG